MKSIEIRNQDLIVKEKIIGYIENQVMPHGTSGRVSCPKRFIGKKAIIIITDDKK